MENDNSLLKAAVDVATMTHPAHSIETPEDWHPERDLTNALRASIRETSLSSTDKAKAVYSHSLELLRALFEIPTAEFIS